MKKFITLALAALIVCALPVMALAANSPAMQEMVKVSVQRAVVNGGNQTIEVARDTGTVIAIADYIQGTFREWMIYKVETDAATGAAIGDVTAAPKYTKAVQGTDYEIVSGTLTTSPLAVRPLTDLVITGNYDKKITDPQTGEMKDTTPKNHYTILLAIIAGLALIGAGFATKKILT